MSSPLIASTNSTDMMTNTSTSICLTLDCSGRGSCIVPDGATNNISMCICDFPWSGKTDILNYDGYDCVDLGLLRQILYGCIAVRHLYNMKHIHLAFKCQLKIFHSIKGKLRKKGPIVKHWWQMLSLKVLTACLINHFMVVYFCLSMAFGYGAIGGNGLASMAYALAGSVGMYASIPININTLKALLSGIGMDKKGKTIVKYLTISNVTAVTLYSACLLGVFTFLPIYTATMTEAPNESTVVPALLIFRNMSVIGLVCYLAWLGSFTSSKVRSVIEQQDSTNNRANSVADEKMRLLLAKLDVGTQQQKKVATIAAILYTTFSLPWLHPFQGYLYTFTFMQVTGAGHPSRLYMEGGKYSDQASTRVAPTATSQVQESSTTTSVRGTSGRSSVASNVEP